MVEWFFIVPPEETVEKSSNNCGICGRSLTDPVSVAKGVGPVCEKHMGPGSHPSGSSQQAHSGGKAKRGKTQAKGKALKARNFFDRRDRARLKAKGAELLGRSGIWYTADDAIRRMKKYPPEVIDIVEGVEVIVASEQFLPPEAKAGGAAYRRGGEIWITNDLPPNTANMTLDHEIGHALEHRIGPKFAAFWHTHRGTRIGIPGSPVAEAVGEEFMDFMAEKPGTIWEKWFKRKRKK